MFNRWNNHVEELAEKPDPQSSDGQSRYQARSGRVEKHRPDKRKMDDYWELFRDVSIIRESIRAFAVEVFSDGYYIETEDDQAREDLEEWLSECGISNADVDLGLADIGKEAIIQQEVRGTALIERVNDEDGNVYGFKAMPPDTVKQYTRPHQSVLLSPDEDVSEYKSGSYHKREDGKVAAYVQWDDALGYDNKPSNLFTRDEVIKLLRDGDVGEVWGNSRLAAVEDRVHSLQNKLESNDQAIESLAWKFWLFQFGTEENPWPEERIKEFMGNHSPDEFQPGEKHGVQGNVDIQTISGEVAEIEDYLGFDIDWIIAGLPYVKYGLGGFEENVNQFVSRSQESRIQNQLQEARRQLAQKFGPSVKDKAEELGYDRTDVDLVIGLSPEERLMQKELAVGNIPYTSSGGSEIGLGGPGEDETDYSRPPASSEEPDGPEATRPELQPGTENQSPYWNDDEVAELADPRLTEVLDEQESLTELAVEAMLLIRDEILSNYLSEYDGFTDREASRHTTVSDNEYRRPADQGVRRGMAQSGLSRDAESQFQEALQDTYDSLEDEDLIDPPQPSFEDRQYVREFAESFSGSVRDAVEKMARDMAQTIRASASRLDDYSEARERAESRFDEGRIRKAANLISGMELRNLVQTTKLREYRRSDEVVGVQVVNPCTEKTTDLCENLAGCDGGEPAVAYFDSEQSVGEQLEQSVSQDMVFEGFSPIPSSPPFHWHCRSELVAITQTDVEEMGLEISG